MSLDTQTATTEAAPETAAPEITTRDDLVGIFAAQLDAEDKGEQPAAPAPEAAAEPATGD